MAQAKKVTLESLGVRQSSPKAKMLRLIAENKYTAQEIQAKMGFQHARPVKLLVNQFDVVKENKKGVLGLAGKLDESQPEKPRRKITKKAKGKKGTKSAKSK